MRSRNLVEALRRPLMLDTGHSFLASSVSWVMKVERYMTDTKRLKHEVWGRCIIDTGLTTSRELR